MLRGGQALLGSAPTTEPGSHPSDVGPCGEGVQVEHSLTPAVYGQGDADDADDVHDYSCSGLLKRNS